MRILFVAPYVPGPIRVRPYEFVRGLIRRGHQVVLACPWSDEKDRSTLEDLKAEGLKVLSVRMPTWRSLLNCTKVVFADTPLQAVYSWQSQLMGLIEEALSRDPFDVVHVEHLRGALYGLGATNFISGGGAHPRAQPAVVWDSVDCISALLQEARRRANSRLKRRIFAFEQPRTESFEGDLVRRFDRVIVTTEKDARSLAGLAVQAGRTAVCLPEVICNGVDLELPTGAAAERHSATVVMTGKMSYHANVAAARHLLEDIMPIVWRLRPDVRVEIVGKDPSSIVLALARSNANVAVTGEVQDIRPYLRRATVAIAPIVYGAGVQNKVLEAMAASAPVVATPLATSALSLKDGCEVLIGHCPEEMALHILRLLENPELRAQMGSNARRYVASHHNWDGAVSQLETVYRKRRMPQAFASDCLASVEA